MGFGLWGNVFQKLEEIFFKLFPQKAIKKRVQAIVKISNANGDGHSRVDNICNPTVLDDAQLNQDIQKGKRYFSTEGQRNIQRELPGYSTGATGKKLSKWMVVYM